MFADGEGVAGVGAEDEEGGGEGAGRGARGVDHADGGEGAGGRTAGARIDNVTVALSGEGREIAGVAGGGECLAGEGDDGGEGGRRRGGGGDASGGKVGGGDGRGRRGSVDRESENRGSGVCDAGAPGGGGGRVAGGFDVAADLDEVVAGAEGREEFAEGVGGEAFGDRGEISGEGACGEDGRGGRGRRRSEGRTGFSQGGRREADFETAIIDAEAGGGDFGFGGEGGGAAHGTETPEAEERFDGGIEGPRSEFADTARIEGDADEFGRNRKPIGRGGGVEARKFGVGAVGGEDVFEVFECGGEASRDEGGIERGSGRGRLEEFCGPRGAHGAAGEDDEIGGRIGGAERRPRQG